MKIYEVSYIGDDDNTYSEFYTDKGIATERKNKLESIKYDAADIDEHSDEPKQKMVFEIVTMDCSINKEGIMNMLNRHFKQR